MKNRILFVGFATFLIVVILICTETLTGENFGKWFNTNKGALLHSSEQSGNVSIIRRGTGYILKQDVGLDDEDRVITSVNSTVSVKRDYEFTIYLDENTQVGIWNSEKESTSISAQKGALYVNTLYVDEDSFSVSIKDTLLSPGSGTIFSVEIHDGTQTINVYKGNIELSFNNQHYMVISGSNAVLLQDEDGKNSIYFGKTQTERLSKFIIDKLLNEKNICFTHKKLNEAITFREEETQAAREIQAAHEAEILAQGGTIPVMSAKQMSTESKDNNSGKTENNNKDISNIDKDMKTVKTCTIEIRCDTIMDNLDDLREGKLQYVPPNGVILNTSKVEFIGGETVYNVLKRVCEYSKIPLEYSWTVEYGGYYIEGIDNIFEFDCGFKSGWMYKVNGWYPNYGCSNYIIKDGDVILWNYTCDYGADLGAEIR